MWRACKLTHCRNSHYCHTFSYIVMCANQCNLVCWESLFLMYNFVFSFFLIMRRSPFDVSIVGFALDQFLLKKTWYFASLMEYPSICIYKDCLQRDHCRCSCLPSQGWKWGGEEWRLSARIGACTVQYVSWCYIGACSETVIGTLT